VLNGFISTANPSLEWFPYFGVSLAGFEGPATEGPATDGPATDGPATDPSVGSGEEDSVVEGSSVTRTGVEKEWSWGAVLPAIGKTGSCSWVGEPDKWVGNDETRAARNESEISFALQSICNAGVAMWERGGREKKSGMVLFPEFAGF